MKDRKKTLAIAAVLAISFFSLFSSSSIAQDQKKKESMYSLCQRKILHGGELMYLSSNKDKPCWKIVSRDSIKYGDIIKLRQSKSIHFVYIFGDDDLSDEDFDPIFNVRIKEISKVLKDRPDVIKVQRAEIDTKCSPGLFGARAKYRKYDRVEEVVDAQIFNRFHLRGNPDEPSVSRFHVTFMNSDKSCDRTDSRRLRKLFLFKPDEIAPPSANSDAIAASERPVGYKSLAVKIGKGSFRSGYYSASFSLRHGPEYEIIVSDLSTYLNRDLRDSIELRISE